MIMAGNNFITYAAVFLVVFVPYLIVQTFIGDGKKHSRPAAPVGIPRLYRMLYPLLAAFSANAGDIMKTLRPAFCKKLAEKLKIANIRIDVSYVVSAQIILATALGIAGMLFSLAMGLDVLWLSAIPSLCIFIGWVYPATLVEKAAEERQASIIKSLPFAIDLISSAMRAGLGYSASVRYYVSVSPKEPPLTEEFGAMLRQMELGKTRVEALEDMAERVKIKEFTSFAGAVIHGTEVGASIVETMRIQGEEMRKARFAIAERKAARAPSLMVLPIALFIMPAFFVMIGTPIYIRMQESGVSAIF